MPLAANAFGLIMRRWDALHPYNAAQAMRLSRPIELSKWREAWSRVMHANTELGGEGSTVETGAGPLESHFTTQLNRRFADGEPPFRPFVIDHDGAHNAGIVYHHWCADSTSVRLLMRQWFEAAAGIAEPRPLAVAPGGCWCCAGPRAGRWDLLEGIGTIARSATRFARARQVDPSALDRFEMACSIHPLPESLIEDIHAAARRGRATVHDLFLAAIAVAVDRFGLSPPAPGRDELALGTVVDLRPHLAPELRESFGLMLGFNIDHVRPADLHDRRRLVARLASQCAHHKRTRSALMSILRLYAGLAEARFVRPDRYAAYYRRRMPLAAAISNVNMNRTWAAEHHPATILDYFRATPTGPAIPLLFTPTTLGRRLNVVLTRRAALLDSAGAERLIDAFLRTLCELTSAARA